MFILTIFLYIVFAIAMADFLTGIFHWWEDRYGNPDWYIWGDIIVKPNILHHQDPSAFTRGSYLKRNWTSLLPTLLISSVFFIYQYYFWSLVFVFASQSNEVHCWEHIKPNRFIRFLQKMNVLQNKKTHALHHKRPYDTNYCVMTMMVNPILNRIYFWYWLETTIYWITGIRPRKEREIY